MAKQEGTTPAPTNPMLAMADALGVRRHYGESDEDMIARVQHEVARSKKPSINLLQQDRGCVRHNGESEESFRARVQHEIDRGSGAGVL